MILKLATLVENVNNFKTNQAHASINYNAQMLLRNMNFIHPELRTGRGPYRHSNIQRTTWFRNKNDIGVGVVDRRRGYTAPSAPAFAGGAHCPVPALPLCAQMRVAEHPLLLSFYQRRGGLSVAYPPSCAPLSEACPLSARTRFHTTGLRAPRIRCRPFVAPPPYPHPVSRVSTSEAAISCKSFNGGLKGMCFVLLPRWRSPLYALSFEPIYSSMNQSSLQPQRHDRRVV
ncbi:hypothetical protein EDB85DRAFT_970748 [Lactarius pseudohatsudake]|nr:hypothetical protein EDB85DRAFT_970748 [Lactarius pseudohatsudake]